MELSIDGRAVFAASGGRAFDPAQESVVLIHGAGMDHTVWALQARSLAHHGRNVLALDLPGHGHSPGPALPEIGAMAALALALLDAAGIARARLAGHSMGALVALEAAAQGAGRIDGLALLGFAPTMPVHGDLLALARAGDPLAAALMTSWCFGRRAELGANPAPGLWYSGGALRLLERAPAASLAADLAACDAYGGAAAAAARVACPTLLLLGAEDRMTPPQRSAGFAAGHGETSRVVLSGVGHMMMIEEPKGTLDAMRKVL